MGLSDLPPDLIYKIGEEVLQKHNEIGFDYSLQGNTYKHLDPISWATKENDLWVEDITPEDEIRKRRRNLGKIHRELGRETAKLERFKNELKTIDQVSEDREVVKKKYKIWLNIMQQDELVESLQNRFAFMQQILFFRYPPGRER